MKRIFYLLGIIAITSFFGAEASAQYHRQWNDERRFEGPQSFYYYPQSNMYYSMNSRQYIFFNRNAWVIADRLPRHMRLNNEPYYVVNHNGFDVWNDNRYHVMQFRNYRRQPDVAYGDRDHYRDRDGRDGDRDDHYDRDHNW